MRSIGRRNFSEAVFALAVCPFAHLVPLDCSRVPQAAKGNGPSSAHLAHTAPTDTLEGETMQLHYLELVTPEVEAVCTLYEKTHGVSFSEANPELGGARTLRLPTGLTLGVRAPMHDGERPVVRPYLLVDDIEAAVAEAEKAGAHIAVPPMRIPGQGSCAIYFQGGIEVGLWQAERA